MDGEEAEGHLQGDFHGEHHGGVEHELGVGQPVGDLRLGLLDGYGPRERNEEGGDAGGDARRQRSPEGLLQDEVKGRQQNEYPNYGIHDYILFLRRLRMSTARPTSTTTTPTATRGVLTRLTCFWVACASSSFFITTPSPRAAVTSRALLMLWR